VKSSTRIARLLSLSCALAVGLLACGAETETATPEQPAETPAAADPTVLQPEVAPPRGFQRVVLPEEFPDDVPQYPGAVLSAAHREPAGGMFATYEAEEPLEKVTTFFREALEEAGWRIETERKLMIFASKGTRTFTLLLDDQGDRTWYEITLLAVD
jgi:hypothetical protein